MAFVSPIGPDNGPLRLNQVWSNGTRPLYAQGDALNLIVWHNNFVNNAQGVRFDAVATGGDVRNNIFASHTADYGLESGGTAFAQLDYNLFFANASGACNGCPAQPNSVFLDPLFINPTNDFELQQSGPGVNAGIDLLLDVNGPAPGDFDGTAPDIGAVESRY